MTEIRRPDLEAYADNEISWEGHGDILEEMARYALHIEKTLKDFKEHGLRCDLTPTMMLRDVPQLYEDFTRYLRRADEQVRARASRVLGEQ